LPIYHTVPVLSSLLEPATLAGFNLNPHIVEKMSSFKAYLHLARPQQYVKNVFVLLPVFFGHKFLELPAISQALGAFAAFCLAASSVYVFNDLADIEEDRRHPVKKHRPLAAGILRPSEAVPFLVVLLSASIIFSLVFLPRKFLGILASYLVLNFLYSLFLKRLAIVDIACIGLSFVLRVVGGGFAANIPISPWIILMTFLLAVFLALAKRRDDLLAAAQGNGVRKGIDGYSLEFVSQGMVVMASVVLFSYVMYTVSPEVIEKHGTRHLYLTSFWVILGILRYLQLALVEKRTGSPTAIVLTDYFMQAVIFCWVLTWLGLTYGKTEYIAFLIAG